jgi:hypothetical protein
MRSTLIALAVLSLLPCSADAQRAEEVAHRNDCRLATQVITTGQPATKSEWAASAIRECGAAAGAAVAEGIRANRASRDMATLARLGNVAVVLRDGAMFAAALEVASDAAASPEARVYASRVLVLGLQPQFYMTYEEISEGGCFGELRGPHATKARGGAPISVNLAERAREAGRRLYADSTAPLAVRLAARCASIHELASFREPLDDPGYIIVVQDLTVTYVCRNRFRVHNPYLVDMKILYGPKQARNLNSTVIPSNSDRILDSGGDGNFEIRDEDGEFIAEAKNAGLACTP